MRQSFTPREMLVDLDDKPAQLDIEYAPHPPSPSYDVIFYDLFIALKSYWGFRELSGPRSGIPVQEPAFSLIALDLISLDIDPILPLVAFSWVSV